ncbi:alpha-ketoglutarate-dependent dioxygenase AlkB family protein [Shewanella donghaensis]|uniref:alpha-ketoglutarate-dependent dioxygenase AlkB family protein n=1 Tax=Shewanella donghaensis TaxID=238836 RepID=UPI0011840B02|nr:alpha-ketoglutarate-dependent dioxygenase AlkB [Shewanella donghaensis]
MKQIDLDLSIEEQTEDVSLMDGISTVPLTYIKGFLSEVEQQQIFSEVDCYPFDRPIITIYGKQHPIPRSQVWFADKGCEYQYSSLLISPKPWPSALSLLRQRISNELQLQTNGVLVNRYENGTESMGWHSDDEAEIVADTEIVSVSLGAKRTFAVRHKQSKFTQHYELESGDLLIMHKGMQAQWQHSVPKRLRVKDCRINLTFRQLVVGYHQPS